MRAYGYIRCSGLSQSEGDGPERQRSAILTYCERNGIEVVDWFEEFHTGTDLEGRPEFRKMRDAMVSDGVRIVIVEKLDRLARSILVQETIIADFKNNSIDLKSATAGEDDLCGDDPTRVLVRQILACFFDYERKMIIGKLKAARDRKRKEFGKCDGRKAFGEKPGEAPILQRMLDLKALGMNAKTIAFTLNVSGVLSRYGKPWKAQVIAKIIAREKKKAERDRESRGTNSCATDALLGPFQSLNTNNTSLNLLG